ncbi:hypothetical protein [Legionella parisiensis]|uniref:General stress protein 69 n=1 Tax=Legionella parisiensis TaxID=45071 RepID=A0A1E5JMB9_9GAMM|nr:hypothetical protein [Legionella parisiensis]OEH45493.1 General stress protein 69 [Legionella parisiensis]STX76367.1 General stress protein 69 [Legionella parisiensis]
MRDSPEQFANVNELMGWTIDSDAMQQIDTILEQFIANPIGSEFMAPPK